MNILVYANCQANQIGMTLSLMLRGKAQIAGIDINNPQAPKLLQDMARGKPGASIDCVVTNHDVNELLPYFAREKIVEIPSIHFGGFHPDVVYFATKKAPSVPLFFKKNPSISALALWGHLNRLPLEKTLSLYREEVFEALGYMDYFDVCCHAIVENFAQHHIDTGLIERFIASRSVFMYGPFHPRLEVTQSLCEGVCERLNLAPNFKFEEMDHMFPDPLQQEYAWGCFPPLAARLGVPGSWMVRHHNEVFLTLEHYLQVVYPFLDSIPRGVVQFFDKDKSRFEEFHKIDEVLGKLI